MRGLKRFFIFNLFCYGRKKTSGVRGNGLVIFQGKSGAIELKGDFAQETLWATQAQIADVFGVERSVVTKHIQNIYKESELEEKPTCAKIAQVQVEGKRSINRLVEHYNLDLIISVGYRVNSKTATKFRQWATKTLRQHITKGFTINRKQISKNYQTFVAAMEDVRALLPTSITLDPKLVMDLVKEFASTWVSLDAYDKDKLTAVGATKKSVAVSAQQLTEALTEFKKALIKKGEATEIFGQERQANSVQGILGNVMQSFAGKALYSSVEEKAAHLLYFMVKNHPFVDGNKRSGAYAFVWFLQKAGILDRSKMTSPALTAITILIAESDPTQKDKMTKLVVQLLKR